jgi:hypothetical protein
MKISSEALIFATVAMTGIAVTCMGFGQNSNASFSITISAPQSVKTGSAAKVDITVKNISKQPIVFGIFNDAARAELNFGLDVLGPDGKRPSETPYMKNKTIHGSFGVIHLKPGETLQVSEDFSKLFDLTPGTYTIRLSRGENDNIPSQGRPGDSDLRKPAGTQPQQSIPAPGAIVQSNEIRLTVVP